MYDNESKLHDVIPKILASASFHDYLLHNQYELDPEREMSGLPCYILKDRKGKIDDVVYLAKGPRYVYFYSYEGHDSGSIVDFVRNRIERRSDEQPFNPYRDSLIEACQHLLEFMASQKFASDFDIKGTPDVLESLTERAYSLYFYLSEAPYEPFFSHYGIQLGTVDSPPFKGRIFSNKGLKIDDLNLPNTTNTIFPLYNYKMEEQGLWYFNILQSIGQEREEINFSGMFSDDDSFWMSNKISGSQKVVRMTLVDTPLEALSHYQYHKGKNEDVGYRRYISFKNINDESLFQFGKLLEQNPFRLILSSSATLEGLSNELRMVSYVVSRSYNVQLLHMGKETIQLLLDLDLQKESEKERFVALKKKVDFFNKYYVVSTAKALGPSSKVFLSKNLINLNMNENEGLILQFPNNVKTLYHVIRYLIIVFPVSMKVDIEKPLHKSWVTQCKLSKNDSINKQNLTDTLEIMSQEELFEPDTVFVYEPRSI